MDAAVEGLASWAGEGCLLMDAVWMVSASWRMGLSVIVLVGVAGL